MPRFKIIAEYDGKRITVDYAADEDEAREKRIRFARTFTSSWKITVEPIGSKERL